MYTIAYLPRLHALEVTVAGFMSGEEVTDLARDLTAARARHAAARLPDSLYNFTDVAIQSQAVVALLQDLARRTDPSRRVALYSDGQAARMQAARIAASGGNIRLFDSRAAAVAWLGEPALGRAA